MSDKGIASPSSTNKSSAQPSINLESVNAKGITSPPSTNKSSVQPSINLGSVNKTNSVEDNVTQSTSSISADLSSPINQPIRPNNNESSPVTSSAKTLSDQSKQELISNIQAALLSQPSSPIAFECPDINPGSYDTRTDDTFPATAAVMEKAYPVCFVSDMPLEVHRSYKAEAVTAKAEFVTEVKSKPEQINWVRDTLTQAKPIIIRFLTESPLILPNKLSTTAIVGIGNPVDILEKQLVLTLQKEIFDKDRGKYEGLASSVTDQSRPSTISPIGSPATPSQVQVQKENVEQIQKAPTETPATTLLQEPSSIEPNRERKRKEPKVPSIKTVPKTPEKLLSLESQKSPVSYPSTLSTADKSSPLPSTCEIVSKPSSADIKTQKSSYSEPSSSMLFERSSETETVPTSSKTSFGSLPSSYVSSGKSSVPDRKVITVYDPAKSFLKWDDEYFYRLILTMNQLTFVRQVNDDSAIIPVCEDCGYLKLQGRSEKCSCRSIIC